MTLDRSRMEQGGLILFLAAISIGLLLVVATFIGALLWAALAAILFQPLFQWLLGKWPGRRNTAAAATILVITVVVVIPALIVGSLVVGQAPGVYNQVRTGQIDVAAHFRQLYDALPNRLQHLLGRSGLDTFEQAQARILQAISSSTGTIARRILSIGSNAASFVLAFGVGLYVSFFLLRDGERIGASITRALPLRPDVANRIADKLVAVVRATIKGSGIVALVQGALGAITFWMVGLPAALLRGVLMAIAALLPAIGPTIIWAPVAVFLLATGAIWQAVVVILSGFLVIGLIDNILRPILVGRNTGIPDWLVLVTTLGGINLVGLSGIIVGPVAGALFLTGWQIMTEQRHGGHEEPTSS